MARGEPAMSKNAAIVKTTKPIFFILPPLSNGRGRMHPMAQSAHDPPTKFFRTMDIKQSYTCRAIQMQQTT
jgi:hypothetical protein